jgi:hypothetical protein
MVRIEEADDEIVGAEAEELGGDVQPFRRVPDEQHLVGAAAHRHRDLVARFLVAVGSLLREEMAAAMDVGGAVVVALQNRVRDLHRLQAGGGAVHVDERLAVDQPVQDREVAAEAGQVPGRRGGGPGLESLGCRHGDIPHRPVRTVMNLPPRAAGR